MAETPPARLIDSHCHLDFPDFDGEVEAMLVRARDTGVASMITICTRVRRFDAVRRIAETHAGVFCTVGTHPHYAGEEEGIPAEEIVELTRHDKVVGIGECGLDYHYDNAPRDAQAAGFRIHIEAARRTGLPVVIHARDADADVAAILEDEMARGPFKAVLHCYTGGRSLAETGVRLGLYVSFSGILTFKKSDDLRAIAADLPRDRVLVETDAPYLAPTPYRGKRNEPAYVRHTAGCLAEVWNVSEAEVAHITAENTLRLFDRMPREALTLAA